MLIAKAAHWSCSQPCDYCNISLANLTSTRYQVKTRIEKPFILHEMNRPLCEILDYCKAIYAFPLESMHILYVNGVVPTIMNAIFKLKLITEDSFFVRITQIECFVLTLS